MFGMVGVLHHQGTKAPIRFDTMYLLLKRAYHRKIAARRSVVYV